MVPGRSLGSLLGAGYPCCSSQGGAFLLCIASPRSPSCVTGHLPFPEPAVTSGPVGGSDRDTAAEGQRAA